MPLLERGRSQRARKYALKKNTEGCGKIRKGKNQERAISIEQGRRQQEVGLGGIFKGDSGRRWSAGRGRKGPDKWLPARDESGEA